MGYDARVKKDRRCLNCGRRVPSATATDLIDHALDCARRLKLVEAGLVVPPTPTGQLVEG